MAEDTEKSIEERIEEARMNQILNIQIGAPISSSEVWDCHREEHEGITDENLKEHIEECLGEMLYNYNDDERNYALDGAVIKCDQMSDKMVFIQFREDGSKISIEGGGKPIESSYVKPAAIGPERYNPEWEERIISSNIEKENIRKLHAAFGNSQSANGIRFATVADRSYLREEKEKQQSESDKNATGKKNGAKAVGAGTASVYNIMRENLVSIVSCGNCKNLKEEDIKKIAENWDGACKYGTCYALMKLSEKWENPYCIESVVGECENDFLSSSSRETDNTVRCTIEEHHKPMRFSTIKGEKEGLTMMSTLLCGKEGIITIESPGQIYIEPQAVNEESGDIEERIKQLTNSVVGDAVNNSEALKGLSTMEILSRLIYQEDRESQKGQNAVLFSIVNRLFSTKGFVLERKNNNIYSVIADSGQYESIEKDTDGQYSGFRPPAKSIEQKDFESEKEISESGKDDFKSEEESWENAKRLAAILYIAIEDYGDPCKYYGENEREENIVIKGDDETYQEVLSFIQQQKNIKGGLIINEIGTRDSFQGYRTDKHGEEQHGGNYFNWY